MKNIFVPPKDQFEDYTIQARFALTWKMFMFNSIFLFLLIFVYYIFDSDAFEESIYAWTTAFIMHLAFLKTKRYRLIGFIYALHAILFLTYTLNFMHQTAHVIEFFWMIVFIIYTFFAIGRKEGYFLLLLSVAGIISYFIFSFDTNIEILANNPNTHKTVASIANISVSMLLIAYLVNQFIRLSSVSEHKYREANRELQNQNRIVQAQNEEKTIMLKEIHHRVKNNLQVISSLLRLQSYEIAEEDAKTHFQDAVYRVVAMALIHEKMYQNQNLSNIDLKDYLKSLAEELISTYADEKIVHIDIDSEIKNLENDTLVPVALIFNELITNSLKHAFGNAQEGKITVELKNTHGSNSFRLIYKDNGKWQKKQKINSFGLELIATLTEQLDGKVKRTYEEGTKYDFTLKNAI